LTLALLIDEGVDPELCECQRMKPGGIMWTDPAVAVPLVYDVEEEDAYWGMSETGHRSLAIPHLPAAAHGKLTAHTLRLSPILDTRDCDRLRLRETLLEVDAGTGQQPYGSVKVQMRVADIPNTRMSGPT
jgi:hypothetical protein